MRIEDDMDLCLGILGSLNQNYVDIITFCDDDLLSEVQPTN